MGCLKTDDGDLSTAINKGRHGVAVHFQVYVQHVHLGKDLRPRQ